MDHRLGALLLAVIALSAAPAAAQIASKCTAQKYKAVGKYAQELAACRAKTLGKGLPPETLCGAKAALKLQKAFEKADRKGDCLGTRDLTFAAGETDGYVESLAPVLESELFCCSFAGLSATACTWQPSPESCTTRRDPRCGRKRLRRRDRHVRRAPDGRGRMLQLRDRSLPGRRLPPRRLPAQRGELLGGRSVRPGGTCEAP